MTAPTEPDLDLEDLRHRLKDFHLDTTAPISIGEARALIKRLEAADSALVFYRARPTLQEQQTIIELTKQLEAAEAKVAKAQEEWCSLTDAFEPAVYLYNLVGAGVVPTLRDMIESAVEDLLQGRAAAFEECIKAAVKLMEDLDEFSHAAGIEMVLRELKERKS